VRLRQDAEVASRKIKLPPSAHELTLMDEALGWPLACLSGQRDVALPLWAFRTSRDRRLPTGLVTKAHHEASLIAAVLARAGKVVR